MNKNESFRIRTHRYTFGNFTFSINILFFLFILPLFFLPMSFSLFNRKNEDDDDDNDNGEDNLFKGLYVLSNLERGIEMIVLLFMDVKL